MQRFSRSVLKSWVVPILLLWVAGIGLVQSYHQTLTSDEAIHTASAYLALTRGDHRFDPEHPFLFKYLTALPFLVYRPNLPVDDQALWQAAEPTFYDSWQESRRWSEEWVYESGNNPLVMQLLMRLPGVAVLVVLNWFVWWLVRRWYDERLAVWALFFTAFNPTLLAHGFMTNTDVPLALAFLLVIWRLGEYGLSPTRRNAVWAGLTIAVALLTKFSAIALIPASFIWLIGVAIFRKQRWYLVLADAGIVLALFFALTWALYLFQSPLHLRPGDIEYAKSGLFSLYGKGLVHMESYVQILPHLLPSAYLKGLLMTIGGGLSGRPTFILGHIYPIGVWFYFPALFILKNQLITVFLGLIALVLALPRLLRPKSWEPYTWVMVVTGGIFLLLAMKSKLNLGVRHITPLMPIFSLVLAATTVRLNKLFRSHIVLPIVVLGVVIPILIQSGNLLGFGNVLISPPSDRYHYFVDSNLDWGQSWQRIANLLKKEFPSQPVYVKYGVSALDYYAPNNRQYDITNAGAEGTGAILIAATDLNNDFPVYLQYVPAFTVDNAYFIYRTGALVPR